MSNQVEFSKTFWTPYEYVQLSNGSELLGKTLIGKEIVVINELDTSSYDFEEVGVLYEIELEDGMLIQAFPEEVEEDAQKKAGREQNPTGFY